MVNMAWHDYHLEPNVRFSPDKTMVFFTSNMFGPAYVIGVEVEKAANPKPSEVISTPALAKKYNPRTPEDTHAIPK
jgi:oligogalacturonide lyase